jgi:serine protease Do
MRKNIFYSSLLITFGITVGVFLVAQFSTGAIEKVQAKESKAIGATVAPVQTEGLIKQLNDTYVNVSESATESVVSISVETEVENNMMRRFRQFYPFFEDFDEEEDGEDDKIIREGGGSGVIISADGYIVTNNHVVDDAIEDGITVTLSDRTKHSAVVVGTDPLTDLAVIKIEKNNLKPAHFEKPDNIKIGQMVLAVGSPLGLNSTVTAGIISATGRGQLGLYRKEGYEYSVENFIQTDAAINPGNSGGGLFNLNGSLVGINTAIASETGRYIGYGFAIPIDIASSVISDLIEDGKVNRGYIGVQIQSVDPTDAKALGLDEVRGVKVAGVLPGKAGDLAGLESGDIILALDGKKLYSSNELQSQIVLRRAGDDVELTIWRDEQEIKKTVTLQSRDDEEKEEEEEVVEIKPVDFNDLGFEVKDLTSDQKEEAEIDNGVIIVNVKRYSHAAKRGFIEGGIITKADRKKVNSAEELVEIIESKNPGDAIMIHMEYRGSNRLLSIEIPANEG